MLRAKFVQWPWAKYDGDAPADPNAVDSGVDVDRVYRLGARTPRRAYQSILAAHGTKISECLRKLPLDQALEDTAMDNLRGPVVDLYDALVSGKHVKLAGASKLLYPFRPKLLPVIDSVVDYYYWYAASIADEPTFRKLQAISSWGEYAFEIMALMRQDVCDARDQIDSVLKACASETFAGASRIRVVESLIWYYYARGGSPLPQDADPVD